jgi:hypothetical protein
LVTEEEEIPGLSFVAFRRTATTLYLPALPATGATHQVVNIDPVELANAVEADGGRYIECRSDFAEISLVRG